MGIIVSHNRKVAIYNLASRIPALVLAVANANIGAGFLYFSFPQTTHINIRCSSRAANVILDINLNTTNMKRLFVIIATIDNIIYKLFGIVTPLRRHYWHNEARKLQRLLDAQHSEKDRINRIKGTNWTTKEAIEYIMS